jgi:hypothetical protein
MKRLKVYMVILVMAALGIAGCPKSQTTPSGTKTDANATTSQRSRQGTTTSGTRTTPSQPNQPGTTGQRTPATGGGGTP